MNTLGIVNRPRAHTAAEHYVQARNSIKTPGITQKVKNLSGNNQRR
ncbi:MAG: hypothetical protein U0Z44_11990 [Kouleothrix sp.]